MQGQTKRADWLAANFSRVFGRTHACGVVSSPRPNLALHMPALLLVDHDERPTGGTAARAACFRCAVQLVDDEAAVDEARARLIRRYRGPDAPLPKTAGFRYTLCILTPEQVTSWDFEKA